MTEDVTTELQTVRAELATIRQAVAADVDRTWTSAWKSPETVDAKVRARLAGHAAYQALRVRERALIQETR
jgi:hypothetical protein